MHMHISNEINLQLKLIFDIPFINMIPLFKLVSLIIRLFTKPFSNFLKQSIKSGNVDRPSIKSSICYLGQKYHRINIRITRNLNNMGGTDSFIKPLSDDKALDSGAEFIGEIIAYGTLLVWGIYEVNKLSTDTKIKEKAIADKIASAHAQINGVQEDYKKMMSEIEKLRAELEDVKEKRVEDSKEPNPA